MGDDWTMSELARNIQRVENSVAHCVNETVYAQAQTNMGHRFEDLGQRLTSIEAERKAEAGERARERQARIGLLIAAGLGFASSLGLFVIQLVAR